MLSARNRSVVLAWFTVKDDVGHAYAEHGIQVKELTLDLAQMLKRKDRVVRQNNDGIVYLFRKNKVTFFHGRGSFARAAGARWEIGVAGGNAETVLAKHVIIATGSTPRTLPGTVFDNKLILDNAGALAIPEVPKRLGVVGAGVIGLEMGSVWRRLGSQVTILEALPDFLGAADEQVAAEAWKAFTKQGLDIRLGAKISRVNTKKEVSVEFNDADGKAHSASFDRLIVAIGRAPNTSGLNAESVGLKLDGRRIAREGCGVFAGENQIGEVTSGTFSPTLQQSIAMAYVAEAHSAVGTRVEVEIRGKREATSVVGLPFYRRR